MNRAAMSEMTGCECYPLNEDETLAEIETPFKYEDGDDILAYVEFGQGFVRFFDDGEVIRAVRMATRHDVTLSRIALACSFFTGILYHDVIDYRFSDSESPDDLTPEALARQGRFLRPV